MQKAPIFTSEIEENALADLAVIFPFKWSIVLTGFFLFNAHTRIYVCVCVFIPMQPAGIALQTRPGGLAVRQQGLSWGGTMQASFS